ncbi:MAG TPA: glutamyl-tRNA reductase [Firmicutes bacterium]|nr:glutamyl-tRNA reductase [Bacillota bacterium]
MDIVLFGLSHTNAPLEIREHLGFKAPDAMRIMSELNSTDVFKENLLLSTCNRTEIYGITDEPEGSLVRLKNKISDLHRIQPDLLKDYGYIYLNIKAVRHLFRVVAGLDSQVVGEIEILTQIKDAYRTASVAHVTGPYLNRLFQHCFRVGKRIRTETGISNGAISVGSIAVDLAKKILGNLRNKQALIIGAGDTGRLVARRFMEAGIDRFCISNRTHSKAEELGKELNGDVIEPGRIPEELHKFDVVISAAGAPEHTITRSMVKTGRRASHLFIDLGVPRDIDPEIEQMPGVFVYNLDDLKCFADEKLARRKQEIPKVEKIVGEETASFIKWYDSISTQQTIIDMRDYLESLREETLDKWRTHLSPREQQIARRITEELMKKILHTPSQSLKGCELGPGRRDCAKCEMFEEGEGSIHNHYNQELKCIFARILFNLEGEDRDE